MTAQATASDKADAVKAKSSSQIQVEIEEANVERSIMVDGNEYQLKGSDVNHDVNLRRVSDDQIKETD